MSRTLRNSGLFELTALTVSMTLASLAGAQEGGAAGTANVAGAAAMAGAPAAGAGGTVVGLPSAGNGGVEIVAVAGGGGVSGDSGLAAAAGNGGSVDAGVAGGPQAGADGVVGGAGAPADSSETEEPCTVDQIGASYVITCSDGSSVTIPRAEDGATGERGATGQKGFDGDDGEDGEDGESCTVEKGEYGSASITCGDDRVTVMGGEQGPRGESACSVSAPGLPTHASWIAALLGLSLVMRRRRSNLG